MPELPEVEYTRQNLERWLRKARITSVKTDDARIVRPVRTRTFASALTGRTVERVDRRGKWLRLMLDDGRRLFVHLGMTGWFEHPPKGAPAPRFDRVRLEVEKGRRASSIVYVDARRWGRMLLADDDIATWKALGPDPLDEGIDIDALEERLARRTKGSIKQALMDQTVLAGVGNIQAIEALWKAHIDPRSVASAVTRADLRAIAGGLRWTIARTLADLAKDGWDGKKNPFMIYGRQGKPCPRCGHVLERIVLGGRTTTFCTGCQERRGRRGRG